MEGKLKDIHSGMNKQADELMNEIKFVDADTLELKKDIQYRGCPFCEIDDGVFIDTYQTRQALFYKFKKCNRCSLIYPYPRPNKTTIENHFKSDRFSEDSKEKFEKMRQREMEDRNRSLPLKIAKILWRKFTFHYSYQEFRRFAKTGYRVLEVGAGQGAVARELIKNGCIVEAVEPNPYRAKFLREELGLNVYEATFVETPLQQSGYDMIVFSQVLMHLFFLKDTIEKIKYVLRPGGLIVSSQMNFNSIIQETARSPYPVRGLTAFTICSYFTPDSLKKILEMSGFDVIDVIYRPKGLFDYVFVSGYPGGRLIRLFLKLIDQIITAILIRTKTTDYFTIVAENKKGVYG